MKPCHWGTMIVPHLIQETSIPMNSLDMTLHFSPPYDSSFSPSLLPETTLGPCKQDFNPAQKLNSNLKQKQNKNGFTAESLVHSIHLCTDEP